MEQNNISCGVVRDLLPLYAENMTGDESRALIEAHLGVCWACQAELASLRAKPAPGAPNAEQSLKQVRRKLRHRRLRIALLSAVTAIAVLCTGFYFLVVRDYPVPYEEGSLRVERRNEAWELDEDGTPALSYYRENHYLSSWGPIQHFNADGSVLVVHFVRLMKYPNLQVKINGPSGAPDGELQGSMLLNWSPDDGDYYTLKVKPTKVTCRVYYLQDFGKLRGRRIARRNYFRAYQMSSDSELSLPLPYVLSEEVLQYCTLIWEGDIM